MTYSVDPGEVEKGQAAQNGEFEGIASWVRLDTDWDSSASTRQVGTGRRIGFWARLTNIFRVENKVAQVHAEGTSDPSLPFFDTYI